MKIMIMVSCHVRRKPFGYAGEPLQASAQGGSVGGAFDGLDGHNGAVLHWRHALQYHDSILHRASVSHSISILPQAPAFDKPAKSANGGRTAGTGHKPKCKMALAAGSAWP